MRTPVLTLSALILLCISKSVSAQTCQAAFSFGETGLTIEFTDQSTSAPGDPITSWLWDFEDGATSILQNPSHTFPNADKYDVCLSITTQSGCTNQLCVRIETCVLDVSVNVGSCNADNEIPVTITATDIFDNAKDVSISIDGQLLPGSPFGIDAASPVTVNSTVPGDGLNHTINVQSDDIGTCSSTYSFQAPDCSSNCFLSSMSVSVAGGSTQAVQVGDNFFSPQNLTISIGDVVEFQWVGDGHSTTSDATTGPDSWNSGVIGFGSVFTVNITNPGVHRYYCIPHGGPNGQGMSGMIVANCPPSGQFSLEVSFSTSIADPAGYNILLDGTPAPGGPFSYNGTGSQSNAITVAGDGAAHVIEIQDVADSSCIISRTFTAPDCGAAPACSISTSASQAGGCNASNQVPVELTVNAINGGASGFNVYVDGNLAPGGPFSYNLSGPAVVTVNVIGDGQPHTIEVRDVDDAGCMASASLTTRNCTLNCSITNLELTTVDAGNPATHIVEVRDFEFVPAQLEVISGDTVEFVWKGAIAHTSTSDATSGPNSWDSGLLGQGATYQVVITEAGTHPYYCIPHGGPGGIGMAGVITALPACQGDSILASISFDVFGTGSGFRLLSDAEEIGQFEYQPGGSVLLEVPLFGDGLIHELIVQDLDEPGCGDTVSIQIPRCAEACLLQATVVQTGACDDNMEVPFELTISGYNPESEGFQLFIDDLPHPGGPVSYNPDGATIVPFRLTGDGLIHEIRIEDTGNPTCDQSFSLDLPNCLEPCAGFAPGFSVAIGGPDSLLVQFTDQTPGTVHQWLWGFGDGATSRAQNPFHTYAQPGIYTVCLLVQDTVLGCNQAVCQELQIGVTNTREAENGGLPLKIFPNPSGKQTNPSLSCCS